MKKSIIFFLVLLLVCTSFVSCENKNPTDTSTAGNVSTVVPQTSVIQTAPQTEPGTEPSVSTADITTAVPAVSTNGVDVTSSPEQTSSPEVTTAVTPVTTTAILPPETTKPVTMSPVTTAAVTTSAQTTPVNPAQHTHTFGEWIVDTPATCTAAGQRHHVCSGCGQSFSETVPATGHTPVTDVGMPATCMATGLTDGTHCSVCQAVLTAQTVIPAKGHTPVTDAAVPPTCTETGWTEGSHCSVCQTVLTAPQEVAALGHHFVNDVCTGCGRSRYSSGFLYETVTVFGTEGWRIIGMGTCTDVDIVIPPEYEGKPVLWLGLGLFKNKTEIQSVIIPDTVVAISGECFYGCTGIKEITIPASVMTMDSTVFDNCCIETVYYYSDYSLQSNSLMKNVRKAVVGGTKIPDYMFKDVTTLTELTIVSPITTIGYYAFSGCTYLTSFTVPDTVTSIKTGAFEGCTNLTSIEITDTVEEMGMNVFKDCTGLTEMHIPGSWRNILTGTFAGCTGLTTLYYPKTKLHWTWEVYRQPGWDTGSGEFVVVCSNGTLTKAEAEEY